MDTKKKNKAGGPHVTWLDISTLWHHYTWICPSLSCTQSTDNNICLHLSNSSLSRGLKTMFFKVNNIITMLIFFKCGFRASAYSTHRLSSQCYPSLHLVSDHSHEENWIFFLLSPTLKHISLVNAATIYIQFFSPDPASMNILLRDSIYTFKRRYDNNLIIPKRYSYLPTTLPLTHKFFINSRQDHYLNMWLEHLLGLIHNYRVSIILCQRFFGNGRGGGEKHQENN